ncbi:hypothetical protein B14911_19875 [Bacillus sp. NRRL B-14911]|nr:hypothetical protein B14911_19875 [Bacillus sp. NRRL B-14911]
MRFARLSAKNAWPSFSRAYFFASSGFIRISILKKIKEKQQKITNAALTPPLVNYLEYGMILYVFVGPDFDESSKSHYKSK